MFSSGLSVPLLKESCPPPPPQIWASTSNTAVNILIRASLASRVSVSRSGTPGSLSRRFVHISRFCATLPKVAPNYPTCSNGSHYFPLLHTAFKLLPTFYSVSD
ncbi:Hypothetical predicted protein [Marmota monax]|uniref:Uncharacterized protein n=1 Tax=Marmota monax TaxID=9995 RepID=A0A5E4AHW8_MARMO|nr:Hypothetical predicted protein [Marmota monax]